MNLVVIICRLNLAYNNIVVIKPFTFEELSNLEILDMTGNSLSVNGLQTASFFGLLSLKELYIGENHIMGTVPKLAASGLYDSPLKILDLHDFKKLQVLKRGSFEDLKHLRELNLSNCAITKVERGWLDVYTHRYLEVLDISKNFLTKIESDSIAATKLPDTAVSTDNEQLYSLPKLEWLTLSNSHRLSKLDGNAFNYVPSLKFLFLQVSKFASVV